MLQTCSGQCSTYADAYDVSDDLNTFCKLLPNGAHEAGLSSS